MSTEDNNSLLNGDNTQSTDYLNEVIQFIYDGVVVPIISNSFRLDEIFLHDQELITQTKQAPEFYDEARTIDEQLTKTWAKKIEYPMSDDHNLARVAQYRQVVKKDPVVAKTEYLNFINDRLLKNNENRKGFEDSVRNFQKANQRLLFSDVVRKLEAPTFPDGREDPLRLLARLPLTKYITTSYFSFIERALELEGKKPRAQVFSWSDGKSKSPVKAEHQPDPDFEPDPLHPAVYHLFGLENYPKTLVMSEDDYLDFLMNSALEIPSTDVIPSFLRNALSDSRLLLLGYHPRNWDFRALFKFILKFREQSDDPSYALQLMPSLENKTLEEKSLLYLEGYFSKHNFKVSWINSEKFIYELSDIWERNTGEQP